MAYRKDKLQEQIRRLISEIMIREIKDPRIGFASITSVKISKDFSTAEVGISVLGTPRERRKSLEGLRSSAGYIQHLVGKALGIRHVPRIYFVLDASVAEGVEMVGLINGLDGVKDSGDDSGEEEEN